MSPYPLFRDRTDAGEQLAQAIHAIFSQTVNGSGVWAPPIVYALPRGGLPVAAPVARLLGCPLDIVVAKKISHPKNPELAIGAVTSSGQVLWATQMPFRRQHSHQREAALTEALNKAQSQLAQLTPACPQVNLQGAIAILVDDGIATGMTMAVAAQALRAQHPAAVWICAPVAPLSLLPWLQQWGDHVIVLQTPQSFLSVSRFYIEFPQLETEEALVYLQQQYNHNRGEGR
jgi:predicted phosphoribosyltransferase